MNQHKMSYVCFLSELSPPSQSPTLSYSVSYWVCVPDINGMSLVCKCAKLHAPLQAVYYSRPLGQIFHMASHMALSSVN